VGDDAQLRLGGDDPDPGSDRGGGLGQDLHIVPAGRQTVLTDHQVEVAAAVGDGAVLDLAHAHGHREVGDGCADVGAPAPAGDQVFLQPDVATGVLPRLLAAEHHPAEHADGVCVAVADVADRPRAPAAPTQEGDEAAVKSVLDPGGHVR